MKDYIDFLIKVLDKMEKLSAWRFVALLLAAVLCFAVWRLPEILAVLLPLLKQAA